MLVDTHCHLYLDPFKNDLSRVYENAMENGIKTLIVPGINLQTSLEAIHLAEKYPGIYAAVGLHPNEAGSWSENQYQELSDLARHPKVVAIGEIGLDYYRDYCPVEIQKVVLSKQLDVAMQVSKPVIIHCRNAFVELWKMLIQSEGGSSGSINFLRGVFHSFSGSIDNAQSLWKNGFKIGITGPLTYKSGGEIQNIAIQTPLEHILIETDSPYLTPIPHRGKRNEPAFLTEIALKLAQLKNLSFEEIEYQTTKNVAQLFGIGANP